MELTDIYELGDIVISLKEDYLDIVHSVKRLFTSLNSEYLQSYKGGVIMPDKFEETELDCDVDIEYSENYKKLFDSRHVHLGTLDMAGFLNPGYDVSFCFETDAILSEPHLLCDHDMLMKFLFYGKDISCDDLFKEEYSQHCEVLVDELNLNDAHLAMVYSSAAEQKIKNFFGNTLKIVNLTDFRAKAIKLYFE